MNLFILALLHKEIAESMMDKHVSKILIEAVQMLCTALHTKVHKSYITAMYLKDHVPTNFPESGLTTFALAMPDEYKTDDPVESYRMYYKSKKAIASWKNRAPPVWF